MKTTRRQYDEEFKKMAVELADAKGSLKETDQELGITLQILTRWRRERAAVHGTGTVSRTQLSQERQEIVRLKKELKQDELGRIAEATRYSKKGGRHLLQGRPRGGPWEVLGFIKAHQTEFPVETMCRVLNVSRSGYYYWLAQRPTKRASENQAITQVISSLFNVSKGRYGSPKITQDLRALGIRVSRPRVARLMKQANLRSIVQKKYVVTTTDSKHTYPVAENHLNCQFNPIKPGQAWVSDLTYIATGEGWLYLTIIMDLYDRKVVGWALSTSMKASETVVPAWQMALKNRPIERNLIFHRSDFYGLCNGKGIRFIIFLTPLHNCIHSVDQLVADRIENRSGGPATFCFCLQLLSADSTSVAHRSFESPTSPGTGHPAK